MRGVPLCVARRIAKRNHDDVGVRSYGGFCLDTRREHYATVRSTTCEQTRSHTGVATKEIAVGSLLCLPQGINGQLRRAATFAVSALIPSPCGR